MERNLMTGAIIEAACKVHSALGPGLLENAYGCCLKHELIKKGLHVLSQVPLPIVYEGIVIELGYRLDLLVEDTVIVELKAVSEVAPIHKVQLLTYLRLSRKPLGLLLNFHSLSMKDGIVRLANSAALNENTTLFTQRNSAQDSA